MPHHVLRRPGAHQFAAGVAALAALVAWEWGRMVRQQGFDVQTVVHGGSVVLAVGLFASGLQWLALTAVAAAAVAIAAMPGSNRAFSALGPLYVGILALAAYSVGLPDVPRNRRSAVITAADSIVKV